MEKLISAREIMEASGLSKNTVYDLMRSPGFPSVRIGKRVFVAECAFREWLANGGTEQKGA